MQTDSGDSLDTMETAAWLILDVVEYMRQETTTRLDQNFRVGLRKKISRQLRQQEGKGDPMKIVNKISRLMDGK